MTCGHVVFGGVACLSQHSTQNDLVPLTLTYSRSVVKIMSSDSVSPVYTVLTAPT